MNNLINFLQSLEQKSIYYKLDKIRDDSILVEVAVPGERWEIEFFRDDSILIEKFKSDGELFGQEELNVLLNNY